MSRAVRCRGCAGFVAAVMLAGCGGTAHRAPVHLGYKRHEVVVGRLPNGEGFGIWAQRWHFQGKNYVQLVTKVVPAAQSMAQIRRELYGPAGSDEVLINDLTPPDDLRAIAGCGRRPVVLLYGLSYDGFASAEFTSGNEREPLQARPLPIPIGTKAPPLVIWGFLTRSATLEMRTNEGRVFFSRTYPPPPNRRDCGDGDPVMYGFASG